MATLFSFASWNVEHFINDESRADRVAQFLHRDGAAPDVFAIFEVEGGDVFADFVDRFPTHHFFITEDLSRMETLVGVRDGLTAFVTQRTRFKSDVPTLRPGALVTLRAGGDFYSLLFLHIKADDKPRSFGLRDDMMDHVRNLKGSLDSIPGQPASGARLIVIGDLNTVGMNLTYSGHDVSPAEELERYGRVLDVRSLRPAPKTQPHTWWGGGTSGPSDLDHAFVSENISLRDFGGGAEIEVRGWPELAGEADRLQWIAQHSDHALLYGEVTD